MRGLLVVISFTLLLGVLLLVPVAFLIYGSLSSGSPLATDAYLTLENWYEVLTTDVPDLLPNLLLNTVAFATIAALLSVGLGFLMAYLLTRTRLPFPSFFEFMNLMSRAPPLIVYVIAWILLFSPRIGLFNAWSREFLGFPIFNIYSFGGMVFSLLIYEVPVVFLIALNALRLMDPSLEEQALLCGAGRSRTLVTIVLPLLRPLLLSTFLLIFIIGLIIVEVPVLIGMPGRLYLLNSAVFFAIEGEVYTPDYNLAATFSLILLSLTIPALLLYMRAVKASERYVTVTGRLKASVPPSTGRWRYVIAAILMGYFFFTVIAPAAVVVIMSFSTSFSLVDLDLSKLSLTNWLETLGHAAVRRALQNSLILATVGATIASFLSFFLAYTLVRIKESRAWKTVLEVMAVLPFTFPSIVLAVGFTWAYIRTPIYATLWILLLFYIIAYLPFVLRIITPYLYQLHPELEESSRIMGAGPLYTIFRIVLPIVKGGFFSTWILTFQLYLREFGGSIVLYKGGTEVLSTEVYVRAFSEGYLTSGAVLGTVILMISLLVYFVSVRYFRVIL